MNRKITEKPIAFPKESYRFFKKEAADNFSD
jgi:hypothetical protein